jgi:hypothetical protein
VSAVHFTTWRRPILTGVAADAEGMNIIGVQGIIINQQQPAFDTVMGLLLPRMLGTDTLHATSTQLMDGDTREQRSFYFAKEKGVFHADCKLRPCTFHLITKGLEDPEHLGHSHVNPEVYDSIRRLLHDIATKYETKVCMSSRYNASEGKHDGRLRQYSPSARPLVCHVRFHFEYDPLC